MFVVDVVRWQFNIHSCVQPVSCVPFHTAESGEINYISHMALQPGSGLNLGFSPIRCTFLGFTFRTKLSEGQAKRHGSG